MSKIKYDYDYYVIGAGSGGVRSARIAASHGAKVGIAEGKFFGGTCVNVGCVPKKLMTYAADYHAHFEDSVGYGWSKENHKFNWKEFIKHKDQEIERLNGIYKNMLHNAGIDIHTEFASFVDDHTIQVGDKQITADKILIATGGNPRKPDCDGAEHIIMSDDLFYLDEFPKHIVFFGAGYIGVEFAHVFHGMGSKVTFVYRADKPLRGFDDDIRDHLLLEMEKQGITMVPDTVIQSVEKNKSGKYVVDLSNGETINCDCVMAAIGRTAQVDSLNLPNVHINPEKGHIKVDKTFRTCVDNIFAVGDVIGRVPLTPVAIKEGHWLADYLFNNVRCEPPSYKNIPTAVFSRPNIGTVGLTEDQAKEEGYDIDTFKSDFKPMVHTLSGRDERTLIKMIVDKKTDKVLGVHMCGIDSPEILQGFGVAIKAGATKAMFNETIGIHPTSAEELVTMR